MPDFELNHMDWYQVERVEENAFINSKNSEADLAKYGRTYAVKFYGDASGYMWTTKTEPVADKKYYGHLQPTSGKSIRFKTDKEPEGETPKEASSNFETVDKQDSINRSVALNNAVLMAPHLNIDLDKEKASDVVLLVADEFYTWLTNNPIVDPFPKDEESHDQ